MRTDFIAAEPLYKNFLKELLTKRPDMKILWSDIPASYFRYLVDSLAQEGLPYRQFRAEVFEHSDDGRIFGSNLRDQIYAEMDARKNNS